MKTFLENLGTVEEHASLKHRNTYRIDTTTRYLFHPSTVKHLILFLKYAKKHAISYFVLGNGSNVILSDTEYDGVVVLLDQFKKIEYQDNLLTVESGVMINRLAMDIIKHGYSGFEWASGIPGTIGGCIHGNAEAYLTSTFDRLESVTFLTPDLKIITKLKSDISYGYRTSFFKENPGYIILSATFFITRRDPTISMNLVKERLERRLATQPLDYPSAGSVFRNPSATQSSWQLITSAGLKGKRIGDAEVSLKHANFIINVGHATGKDVRDLIEYIKNEVKRTQDVELILEQEYKDW